MHRPTYGVRTTAVPFCGWSWLKHVPYIRNYATKQLHIAAW